MARPEFAITFSRMRRAMPATPAAAKSPPTVVGIRLTRSPTTVV